ncbi:MAG TPA: DUF262 domain-containing protein [Terriglobales bacterium]|nr:DUF262 domain-containing protein [Terriglobales bacterium]
MEFDRVAMESQLVEKQRTIDYDTKEFTVELLVQKLDNGDFFIPPYQREFIWHDKRRAKFIESVLLGLPIPFMFAADTKDGILEIVDGAQRLRTLREFLDNKLILRDLEQLTNLAGRYFADLPTAQQRKFKNRTLRMVVLADKTTDDAKYDIFQRINTGSDTLRSSEVRKGAYRGPFYSFVEECAGRTDFMELCPVGRRPGLRREREELVLRFFAYSERYDSFRHDVQKFLDDYTKEKNKLYEQQNDEAKQDRTAKLLEFDRVMKFVAQFFPYGFAKTANAGTTPRVRFEAIAVGVNLALRKTPQLNPKTMSWLEGNQFKSLTTTHGSNSQPRLAARIEFVRDTLLSVG